jgi:EAL domain-containing protein (putative c-di-GMP-specific phosphodiesterase class I)/heme oxygenase
MLIEQSLEAALRCDREQFRLALQPIVDAGSGAVLSWEVLLRWDHPLLGNIPPSEFIPIAESNGLIEDVGDLVLEAALRHLVEVPPSVELIGRDVSLSVNVSPSQLTRAGFAAEIGAMLDARGIEHSRLCLEITEAVLTNPQAVATLADARRLGILVAIDAFGIGQSSLATLQQLPADIVKLDRSFLPEQESATTGGRSFLTAVVALAHSAGLRVVVEGVENQVQLNAVVIAGADAIQGYLLGEPMPTEAAVAVACKSTEERSWQPKFAEAAVFAASASLAAESPGILERLRSATRAAHASIERVPRLNRLLTQEVTATDYLQTLRLLHAFHASIEPDLARCLRGASRADALLDGKGLAALAADIAWFGGIPLEPRPLQRPPTCVASALGALYVIEGSNLGGRVIGRHIAKTLGVGPGTGGSFYCGLSAEDARLRWRLLQEVLRLEIDAPATPWEPVTSAALATFDSLETWMSADTAPPRALLAS